ncbi:MAG: cardiolipin synthase [Bacilli bacterium]|nr:cardiolipin synthase [Bacilli bacterium]
MLTVIIRGAIVLIGLILQILLFLFTYLYLGDHITLINTIYQIAGFIIALYLIRNSRSYSYTLPWIVIILLFPLIGTLLYLIIGYNKKMSKTLKSILRSERNSKKYLVQNPTIKKEIRNNSRIKYITDYTNYPATTNNDVSYYPLGEIAFEEMLKELKDAEKFIFFEYFIIAPGVMWDSILEVLKEKVKQGVEVRVMYDDLGCFSSLKSSYPKELEKYGIKCVVFNKLSPLSGIFMNNRDHRKILVIDGKVAFSGGINIADEYINVKSKYGHWKDNAIKVSGDAVWNFTVMFLTIWNAFKRSDSDFEKYKHKFPKNKEHKGYAIPYGETPLDEEVTGQNIYLNIINQANDYIYICTPYLIIDTDMINALTLAAKRGVDVRIIIPGIPDKKIVYSLSESYIEPLVKYGVKVYRYKPGFVHAKMFIADDKMATVGTINLDYRSLYLHFECGLYMEDVNCIKDIKKDILDTLEKSKEVSKKEAKPPFLKAVRQALLRLVAPLM